MENKALVAATVAAMVFIPFGMLFLLAWLSGAYPFFTTSSRISAVSSAFVPYPGCVASAGTGCLPGGQNVPNDYKDYFQA